MSINIGDYSFNGPYLSTDSLEDKSGVYAILYKKDDKYYILDIGESSEVKTRVEGHDRKNCWEKNNKGTIYYSVFYTPNKQQSGRKEVEQELRDKYNPPCGDQ